ncbi:MAG: ABC transporter ATP-binding protein, partial [Deltaproteobacteria bacterium]|nr:ABC transporter ATP-binding protein [Deltaproteobacteria bacterium]
TVISGPSGSGKTTLLNMVGCLDVPTEGTVLIEGHDVSHLSSRALARIRGNRIGFIFQSFNLIPVLTAVENVELALQLAGHNGNRHKKARELLAAVGLGEMTRRRPNQLSGGQQQRVAVARALVKDPALVIADEPTANLDTENGRQVLDIMRKMNAERGVTFLFSTHEKLVIDMARRVVTLRDGRVVSDVAQNAGEA